MILIDELLHCDEREIVCGVTIREDAPFVQEGRVPALISLEYFAQTVAALFGYQSRHQPDAFRMGMLLGTRELELLTPYFEVGDALTITGHEEWRADPLARYRCELHRGAVLLAHAAISVVQGGPPPGAAAAAAARGEPGPV